MHLSAFLFGIVGWQAGNGMQWTGECIKNDGLLGGIRQNLTFLDPGVEDNENDLTTFYDKDLVVSVSKSADELLIGANQRSGLEEFEKKYGVSLNYL